MKYLGAALIILAALLIARSYKRMLAAGLSDLGEVLSLVRHIRERVGCRLEPPRVWARDYSSESCEIEKMLEMIRGGARPSDAYDTVSTELGLSTVAREILTDLFGTLGSEDISAEKRAIAAAEDKVLALYEAARREVAERSSVATALALMLSVGGVIVII